MVLPVFGLLQPAYRALVASGCTSYYALGGERVEFSAAGDKLVFRCYERPSFEGNLETRRVVANLVFLLALLLVTPGMRPLNRLGRVGAGTVLLFFSHLLFIVTKVEITFLAAEHPLAGWEPFWRTTDNFLEITGKPFFPIAIWLLLAFPYLMGTVDRKVAKAAEARKAGRNQPCPCGSGKKFKHCCGA